MLTICAERFASLKTVCPSTQPTGTTLGFEIPSVSPTVRTVDHQDTSSVSHSRVRHRPGPPAQIVVAVQPAPAAALSMTSSKSAAVNPGGMGPTKRRAWNVARSTVSTCSSGGAGRPQLHVRSRWGR